MFRVLRAEDKGQVGSKIYLEFMPQDFKLTSESQDIYATYECS